MMTEKIAEIVYTLTGISGQEAEFFAQTAQLELTGYLKKDMEPENYENAFIAAAAILAAAMLRQNGSAGIKSYSAGQTAVTYSDSSQSVESARKQAKTLLREYIQDDGMIFKRVKN